MTHRDEPKQSLDLVVQARKLAVAVDRYVAYHPTRSVEFIEAAIIEGMDRMAREIQERVIRKDWAVTITTLSAHDDIDALRKGLSGGGR